MLKHGEGVRARGQLRPLPPSIERGKGTGPPFPSYSSFLAFLSFRREQEKRREREGERRHKEGCIFNGKSKEKTRREMMGRTENGQIRREERE